jgi:hypothetical protein
MGNSCKQLPAKLNAKQFQCNARYNVKQFWYNVEQFWYNVEQFQFNNCGRYPYLRKRA